MSLYFKLRTFLKDMLFPQIKGKSDFYYILCLLMFLHILCYIKQSMTQINKDMLCLRDIDFSNVTVYLHWLTS